MSTGVECPPAPLDVKIDYDLEVVGDGGLQVRVRSNLPDSSELMVSLFSEPQSYLAQDTKALEDGRADFGPFTDEGAPLVGAYDLSITLPIARNQPDEVQACIGKSGELMSGPLVSRHDITGDNVAAVEERVTLGPR